MGPTTFKLPVISAEPVNGKPIPSPALRANEAVTANEELRASEA